MSRTTSRPERDKLQAGVNPATVPGYRRCSFSRFPRSKKPRHRNSRFRIASKGTANGTDVPSRFARSRRSIASLIASSYALSSTNVSSSVLVGTSRSSSQFAG